MLLWEAGFGAGCERTAGGLHYHWPGHWSTSSPREGKCLVCSTALLSEQTRAAHWLFAGCKAVAVLNSKQQNTSGYICLWSPGWGWWGPKIWDVILGFSSSVQYGPDSGFRSHNMFKKSLWFGAWRIMGITGSASSLKEHVILQIQSSASPNMLVRGFHPQEWHRAFFNMAAPQASVENLVLQNT